MKKTHFSCFNKFSRRDDLGRTVSKIPSYTIREHLNSNKICHKFHPNYSNNSFHDKDMTLQYDLFLEKSKSKKSILTYELSN